MSEEERPKISVEILGERREIEATDCWLRVFAQLAWAEPQNYFFHNGYYCWNNRCRHCIFQLDRAGSLETVQACLCEPASGDVARTLPETMKRLPPAPSDPLDDDTAVFRND